MKIKLVQMFALAYILLVFIFLKKFSIIPIIFFGIALLIDYFVKTRTELKNTLYFMASVSAFVPLFVLFVLYLPFAVFGCLLKKKGFTKSYVLGFAISFAPAIFLYIVNTYFSVPLTFLMVLFGFYLLPVIAFALLKNKSFDSMGIDSREAVFLFIALFSVTIIASGIVNSEELFISNGTRVYARLQYGLQGLINEGFIPLYNPGTGQGEATFLWDAPSMASHFIFSNFMLKFFNSILFFNVYSFFILFISVLSLGLLYESILNKEKSISNILAISAVTISIALTFHFLQLLESLKQFTAFPLAYFLLAIIVDNPTTFREFFVMAYVSSILMTVHSAYGFGVLVIAASVFILRKSYCIKDGEETKRLVNLPSKTKLFMAAGFIVILLLPVFYFANGLIFKEHLRVDTGTKSPLNFLSVKTDVINFFRNFFTQDISVLSFRYADVNRIDDQVLGAFISVFGIAAFFVLIFLYKVKEIKNFRAFTFGYIIYLLIFSVISARLLHLSGLWRTTRPYLIILLGASMLVFICMSKKNYVKNILTAAVFISFIHAMPYAMQNINSIHKENFISSNAFGKELDFIRQLPIDGRIMDYGLFNNVIDFGSNLLTGRYFSRDEREELAYFDRNIYFKIHEANSFGDPAVVSKKTGLELANLLSLGGFKYLFLNICHPTGNLVLSKIYPDFSYPIYQNNCMTIFIVNNTNYAEKIGLTENMDDDAYKKEDGYKYTTISRNYGYDLSKIKFTEPIEPVPLNFERISPTKINILGDFNDNEWILFKERYWKRWNAFVDGKEVPVFADMHEQILIKTYKGGKLILEYAVLPSEKIFAALSAIAFLAFGFIILLLANQPE